MTSIPPYTIGGVTRPELFLDPSGNIVLTPAAQTFADTYGIKALYLGCPPGTPWPPVTGLLLTTPVDTDATANTVLEGAAVNTAVHVTASAHDIVGFPITYSLTGDTSGGGFKIDPNTGVVTVANPAKIDFESSPGHAYAITVQASDGIFTSSQNFTIAVGDVAPTAPTDTNAAANTVAEGAAHGTAVGVTAHATDINGGALTYSLTGDTSGGGFAIDATTGVVTVADPTKIDYESSGPGHSYTVTAQASDGALTSSQTFTIAVSDVTIGAPVDSDATSNTVIEGAANGTHVGITASAIDPNGPATTYALIADTSLGGFTINAATGVVTVADSTKLDYESAAGHAYNITVQATNGATVTSQVFTIGVTDAPPSAPVDSDAAANTLAEGAANGSTVGVTAHSTDINGGTVTYSLTGDTSLGGFTINAATGVITVADSTKIDYESSGAGHSYTVTAQASDGTLTSSQTFTIGVTDVAPSTPVDSNAAANSVVEGAANGSAVGVTAHATDINGGTLTYSLTGDTSGGGFTINAATGVVTIADSTKIDYETAAGHAYTITAQASDGTLTSSQTFTIGVTDVAPSAPVDSDAATNTVAEGAANGSTVGVTAHATDVNGPAVTYTLVGDTSGGGFTIDATTGVVTVADSTKIDYESSGAGHSYTVTAQASDGTLTNSQAFVINVTDVAPSTPVDSDAAANVVAVGAPVGSHTGVTASSTDVNGPAVTYSLVGDTSGGGFTINSATGVVTVADPSKILAADPSYDVTVDSSDGTLHSQHLFTIDVIVDAAPVVTAGHTLSYTENQAATAIDPAVTVTDSDNANLAHATVQITGHYVNGEDVLGFTNQNGITGSFDAATGTMTLSGSSSVANYQTAIDSVTYFDTSDNPSGLARTVTIIANDGTIDSAPATDTINVTPVNDPPVVTAGHTLNYTENQAATAFDSAITVSDVDSANLASATVQITGNYANGQDILAFSNTANITGTFNAGTGTLTLTGSDTVAHYQAALESVTYFDNSDNPSGLARTVTIIANDGVANSTAVTDTINVTPVDDAPVTTAGGSLNYTENHAATAIDPSVTVSDVDSANMSSATVQITGNFANGQDVLGFTNQNGITGSYNAATGVLTLSGSSSVANYTTALDSVTYFNSSDDPSGLDRTISYTVNDGTFNSNTSTSTIHVTPVNDAPVNVTPAAQTTLEDTSLTFSIGNGNAVSVGDVDAESGSLQVNLGVSHGLLTLSGTAGLTVTGNGTAAVQLTGTVANIDAALNGLVYAPAANFNGAAADTLTITTNDLGNTGTGGALSDTDTVTINITPVNDAPSFTVGANQLVNEDSGTHSVTNFATGISAGPADESGQTVNFIVSNNNAAMFSVAPSISSTGTLTYTTAANYSGTATVTVQIHDNGGTANGGVDTSTAQTFVIDASPIADTPTFTTALTPVAVGADSQVDNVSTGIQNTAAVTALLNGGYVVAWQDTNEENTEAQLYDATGTKIGTNFAITPGDIDGGGLTDTAADTLSLNGFMTGSHAGSFLVIDAADSAVTGGEFIEGRIVSSAGVVGTSFQISPDTSINGDQGVGPATSAIFSDGSFIVVWEEVLPDASSIIEAQRYNASGAAVHKDGTTAGLSNFQVSTQSGGTAERPSIAVLSNGNFVISWAAEPGNDLTHSDVFFQIYNPSGGIVQATTEANSTTTGEQSLAQVAALANGGFAMVWTTDPTGSNTDIVARLFNASGTATSSEITVNTSTTGEQDSPSIVALPDGGFLVTWDSNQDSGGSEGIFAQRLDASGNKVGGQFEINSDTTGAQTQHPDSDHNPEAVLNNGKVVSVWDGAPGDGGDIFQRLFTVPGDGGENSTGIGLGAITALVTDLVGTTTTNGGHEIIDHLTLSGFPSGTFSVGHAGAGGTWVIDNPSDITAIASSGTQVDFVPAGGYTGNFTLSITATVTDTATLSTGDVTNSLTTSALNVPVGVKAPGDPIFAADSATPFDLHLDPVASGDTVTINSLPGNGHIEYADGTLVAANAVLTAAQFALLKFAPSDLGADTAADFQFTVSDGTSDTLNTVPINLVHGTSVTIDGSVANDHIIGSPGNDVLNGGPGFDLLTGGGGADRFVFDSFALTDATASTPQIDHVTDYSAAQGDTIDLTAIFSALSATSNLSSLVHATEDASGTFTTVQINTASSGQAAHWVNIAQLDGISVGDTINVNLDPSHPATAFQIHSESVSGMTPAVSIGTASTSGAFFVSASTPVFDTADFHAPFGVWPAGTPASFGAGTPTPTGAGLPTPLGADIHAAVYTGLPVFGGSDSFGFFHV